MLFIIASMVLTSCTTRGKYAAMRRGLDSINQCNRNDLPFTVQDVEPYVNFFDKHGKPNDQLLAHYLLGRAYYESHEAPMALQCYHEAIECADTAQKDCDFKQLSRVYAQMAQIFYDQGLYRQQLESDKQAEEFAWIAKDTLAALMCYEQIGMSYMQLNKLDSAIIIIEDAAKRYEQFGYHSGEAIALGSIALPAINLGYHDKARRYMSIYETESNLCDQDGNIIKGKEAYYYTKGMFYLKENNLTKAEYWFRREMCNGKDYNNQSGAAYGLALVYEQSDIPDSTAKYYKLAYAMNDSMHAQKATEEVERMQAMYDYTRHQEAARRESEKSAKINRKLLMSLCILLIVILVACWLYVTRKHLIENLGRTYGELEQAREELEILLLDKDKNLHNIAEKEKRIKQLEHKLGKYVKLVYFGAEKADNNLRLSSDYQKIRHCANKGQELTEAEWEKINCLIVEHLPGFHDFITSKIPVDTIEYRICLLLRLHFGTKDIANMLGVTSPYISKISSKIQKEIFYTKGSSKALARCLCGES